MGKLINTVSWFMGDSISDAVYDFCETVDYWSSELYQQFDSLVHDYIFSQETGCILLLSCVIWFVYKFQTLTREQRHEQLDEATEHIRMREQRLREDMVLKKKCMDLLSIQEHSLMAMVDYTKELTVQLQQEMAIKKAVQLQQELGQKKAIEFIRSLECRPKMPTVSEDEEEDATQLDDLATLAQNKERLVQILTENSEEVEVNQTWMSEEFEEEEEDEDEAAGK